MDIRGWLTFLAVLIGLALGDLIPWWVLFVALAAWGVHTGYISRRKQALEEAEEEAHIAREAPELAGMDFVARSCHLLKVADVFAEAASASEKEEYLDSVAKMKDLFASNGMAMPSWFHLVIVRTIERRRALGSTGEAQTTEP